MKGVVLAGGLGTRLLPLTKVTNKHLLPVYDKPMIYYPIQTLVNAGITDIMLVTGGNSAGDFLKLLGNGKEFQLRSLNYTYQQGEGGIDRHAGLPGEGFERARFRRERSAEPPPSWAAVWPGGEKAADDSATLSATSQYWQGEYDEVAANPGARLLAANAAYRALRREGGDWKTVVSRLDGVVKSYAEVLREEPDNAEAAFNFEFATRLDPSFALAHVGKARVQILKAEYYRTRPRQMLEAARQSVKRAMDLDPDLFEAHLALGEVRRMLEWDWRGAEAAYAQAIVLNPSRLSRSPIVCASSHGLCWSPAYAWAVVTSVFLSNQSLIYAAGRPARQRGSKKSPSWPPIPVTTAAAQPLRISANPQL